MAIEVYWGSGSPYSWRVLLALEHKGLAYTSHLLQFSRQEHKSPQILGLNFRGRVPILKDGDYVVFESLAVLYYLDLKYPQPPIFGQSPEEAGVIMRVICEYQAYVEEHLMKIVRAVFDGEAQEHIDALADSMHVVAREARSIEARLSRSAWVVGERFSAADIMLGSDLHFGINVFKIVEARPAFAAYLARCAARPAFKRAQAIDDAGV